MAQLVRTEEEINNVLNLAAEGEDMGSRWPGQSYEQGVRAGIEWVLGYTEDNPMPDE